MAEEYFKKAIETQISDFKTSNHNLNEETLESIDELIKINELGLLTDDSQQGLIRYGKMPIRRDLYAQAFNSVVNDDIQGDDFENNINERYEKLGGKWKKDLEIVEKERAYLVGFATTKRAHWLVNILNQQDNIIAWSNFYNEESNMSVPVTYIIAHQENLYSPYNNAPLYPFTSLGTWNEGISETLSGENVLFPERYNDQYLSVKIIDTRYGHHVREEDGLFKKVIQALIDIELS